MVEMVENQGGHFGADPALLRLEADGRRRARERRKRQRQMEAQTQRGTIRAVLMSEFLKSVYVNSVKKDTSFHCQLRLFSANLTCKYLNEHNKIQQLRHKLNRFHRHVTNRNGIMCP